MAQPTKKLKKILCIMGITGVVYVGFQYLLPLVIPFLFAWLFALILEPCAGRISGILTIRVRGKRHSFPIGLIGAILLLMILAVIFWAAYVGGRKLCAEACMLFEQLPVWMEQADAELTGTCYRIEEILYLKKGVVVVLVRDMLKGFIRGCRERAMPYLMANSVFVLRAGVQMVIIAIVLLVAVALLLQELQRWRRRIETSLYREELMRAYRVLVLVGNAYVKTQGLIMVLTSLICIAAFWLMKNPYYILAGIGIGLLDALPVFGTGTVLIPWVLLCLVRRKWGTALAVGVLYLTCYFLREVLEAKLMGDKVGLSPLETLIAMYVGLQLFGITGFLLGPIGLLLIREFAGYANPQY